MLSQFCRPAVPALLGALTAVLATGQAQADPAPPYAALLAEAQSRAPRLAESAGLVRQAEGLAQQALARPNPTVGLQLENFAGQGAASGLSQAETTFSVSQPLELGGKRAARVLAGRAGVDVARARQVQARWDYASELAIAYAQAEAADRRVMLAQDTLGLAQENLRIARILVDAGREAELRTLQTQSAVTAAQAEVEAARAAQAETLGALSALAGSSAPFTSITQGLLTAPPVTTAGLQLEALPTPAVLAAEAEVLAASRRVNVERVRARPDVTASLGVRRNGGDRSTGLVAGVSLPLPLFDQNRGNINAAQGELAAAEARLQAARLDAQAGLRTALFQLNAADARVRAASEAEASADETYRLTRTGYESGKLPLLELLNAQRALADAHAAVVNAQLARVRAEADLARLQGRAPFGG